MSGSRPVESTRIRLDNAGAKTESRHGIGMRFAAEIRRETARARNGGEGPPRRDVDCPERADALVRALLSRGERGIELLLGGP